MKKWINKNQGEENTGNDYIGADSAQEESPDKTGKPAKTVLIDRKKPWSLKKKIIVTVVSVLGAVVLGIGIFVLTTLADPLGRFDSVVQQVSRTPSPAVSQDAEGSNGPVPTPTLDEFGKLVAMSNPDILKNTVNVLLIGTDYAPERDFGSYKDYFHADVMIVVAINRNTNEVNLISLPRDTYAKIPDVRGIYKINASMDCGGGWKENPQEACKKVCDAASWMIGGIPIEYYYAVDMTAVKGLVDAVGGVDFDVDLDFKIQGRSYQMGKQHMNGQAVLDYLRVRKDSSITSSSKGETGDLNRINRQKNMLVAIFQKLKDSGLLAKIPAILDAFEGNLYTNLEIADTAAFAAFAYFVDSNNIKMHSMDGSSANIFNWNFVLTSEKKRADIIKQVYGFDINNSEERQALEALYGINVPSYKKYTSKAAYGLWQDMQIEVTSELAREYLDKVKGILDADAAKPVQPAPEPVVTPTPGASEEPATSPTEAPTPAPTVTPPPGGWRQYLEAGNEWTLYNKAEAEYKQLVEWNTGNASRSTNENFKKLIGMLHDDVQLLYTRFALGTARTEKDWDGKYWHVNYGDHPNKTGINQSYMENEIPVDFN